MMHPVNCRCFVCLVDRSSFGEPDAKAARESVSDEQVAKVMARVRELDAAAKGYERGRAEVVKRVEAVLADGPDTWTPYESRDTGWTFLEESVLDFTAALRDALAEPEGSEQ